MENSVFSWDLIVAAKSSLKSSGKSPVALLSYMCNLEASFSVQLESTAQTHLLASYMQKMLITHLYPNDTMI